MSPASASVAVTGAPMSCPAAVFSAKLRDSASVANTGAALALSSSLTVTGTVTADSAAYSREPLIACVRMALSGSVSASWAARTVTVFVSCQKSSETKTSVFCTPPVLGLVSSIVTSALLLVIATLTSFPFGDRLSRAV